MIALILMHALSAHAYIQTIPSFRSCRVIWTMHSWPTIIQRSDGSDIAFNTVGVIPGGVNFFQDNGLQKNEVYYYKIRHTYKSKTTPFSEQIWCVPK